MSLVFRVGFWQVFHVKVRLSLSARGCLCLRGEAEVLRNICSLLDPQMGKTSSWGVAVGKI